MQSRRLLLRWPMKTSVFAMVFTGVLYPNPVLLWRHIQHIRRVNELPNPAEPSFAGIELEFDQFLRNSQVDANNKPALFQAVEKFVYQRIPYAWDWDTWDVADYIPTLSEIVAKGREDCDGRAVVSAALLRQRGIDARLVADVRHVWVRTPKGDLMQPMGPPVIQSGPNGIKVKWGQLLDPGPFAFGISVFPFAREVIILMTLWALLLPIGIPPMRAVFGLILLWATLMLLRISGVNPRAPQDGLILLAGGFLIGAVCILVRTPANSLNIPAGLSVGASDAAG